MASAKSESVYHSMREFDEATFPGLVARQTAASDYEHPSEAGTRLAKEVLATLPASKKAKRKAGKRSPVATTDNA
jgi:hypothetical protein